VLKNNHSSFLRTAGLILGFKGTPISTEIDLAIEKGEVLALIGPSGCGKSTLLNTIVGGQPPLSGSVFIAGVDVGQLPIRDRGVGIMFQQPFLFPHLNVFENVAYGLKQQGKSKNEISKEVNEVLEFMKLGSFSKRSVLELSGGQAQRISLARTIVTRPRLLLLDEPLSALDAELRSELAQELRAILQRHQITTIFVTHDKSEASVVSDRVSQWIWEL
jgi:ABC-type Fe3+/spermidine/putrescine transport system ATPase subunit